MSTRLVVILSNAKNLDLPINRRTRADTLLLLFLFSTPPPCRRAPIPPRIPLANLSVLGGCLSPSGPRTLNVAKSLNCSILQHIKRTGEPGMPCEGLSRLACCGARSVFQAATDWEAASRRKLLPLNRLRTDSIASFRRPLAKLFSVSAPVSRVPARLTAACSGGFRNPHNATTMPKSLIPLLRWAVTKSGKALPSVICGSTRLPW